MQNESLESDYISQRDFDSQNLKQKNETIQAELVLDKKEIKKKPRNIKKPTHTRHESLQNFKRSLIKSNNLKNKIAIKSPMFSESKFASVASTSAAYKTPDI